jgi:hypothetical protein
LLTPKSIDEGNMASIITKNQFTKNRTMRAKKDPFSMGDRVHEPSKTRMSLLNMPLAHIEMPVIVHS